MKTKQFLGSLIAMFAAIILFAPSQALAAAFGISPPWIENDNLRPGSNFVYVINVSSNELPEKMTINSRFTGDPEISEWLTIQNPDSLKLMPGRSIVQMAVNVNVPKDAKLGNYQGSLQLALTSETAGTKDIAVLLGGNIMVDLDVIGYDVSDYWVKEISVNPITEGQAVSMKAVIKNLGNTNVTNAMTKISVVDKKTGVRLVSGSTDQLNVAIQPNTMTSAELSVPAPNLKAGSYWVDIESFKDGRSVYVARLNLVVEPAATSNSVGTAVQVTGAGGQVRAAAPVATRDPGVYSGETVTTSAIVVTAEALAESLRSSANVQTTVRVKAPLTNQLIAVMIGLLVVLIVIVSKFYTTFKKRRR